MRPPIRAISSTNRSSAARSAVAPAPGSTSRASSWADQIGERRARRAPAGTGGCAGAPRCSAGAMASASAGRNARSIAAAITGKAPPAELARRPASQIADERGERGALDRRPAAPARRRGQKEAREHRRPIAEQHLVAVPQRGRQGRRQRHGAHVGSEPERHRERGKQRGKEKEGAKAVCEERNAAGTRRLAAPERAPKPGQSSCGRSRVRATGGCHRTRHRRPWPCLPQQAGRRGDGEDGKRGGQGVGRGRAPRQHRHARAAIGAPAGRRIEQMVMAARGIEARGEAARGGDGEVERRRPSRSPDRARGIGDADPPWAAIRWRVRRRRSRRAAPARWRSRHRAEARRRDR